jgi:site-specific DNA-methyltransferase (adenine-specific)
MRPYYDDGRVVIYHGDAAVVSRRLPDPDLIFTDPPYGIAYAPMRGGMPIANDTCESKAGSVLARVLDELNEARAAFVCCEWRSIAMVRSAMEEAGLPPKCCIVWDKLQGVQNLDRFAKQHEFLLYAGPYGGEPTVATDVWRHARDYEPDHPTPKPVPLVAKAILSTTDPGALVVDPFMGSGTTLRAAKNVGRRAIGIEIEERYCELAARRCAQDVLDLEAAA